MDNDEDDQIGVRKAAGKKAKGGRKKSTTSAAKAPKAAKKTTKGRRIKNLLESDSEDESPVESTPVSTGKSPKSPAKSPAKSPKASKRQKLDEPKASCELPESSDELFKSVAELGERPAVSHPISTQIFTATSRLNVPLHENKPLNWSHKIRLIGEKSMDRRVILCEICKEPILFYGRLFGCKHAFCFDCAVELQEKAAGCLNCNEHIVKIDRVLHDSLYMCDHDNCKRTYVSQRDLSAHVQHRHMKKEKSNSSSEKSIKLRSLKDDSFGSKPLNHHHSNHHYPQPSLHTIQWANALAAASSAGASGHFVPPNTFKFSSTTPTSGWPSQNRNYP